MRDRPRAVVEVRRPRTSGSSPARVTPSARAAPRTNVVLPAPSSPETSTTSPGRSAARQRRAGALGLLGDDGRSQRASTRHAAPQRQRPPTAGPARAAPGSRRPRPCAGAGPPVAARRGRRRRGGAAAAAGAACGRGRRGRAPAVGAGVRLGLRLLAAPANGSVVLLVARALRQRPRAGSSASTAPRHDQRSTPTRHAREGRDAASASVSRPMSRRRNSRRPRPTPRRPAAAGGRALRDPETGKAAGLAAATMAREPRRGRLHGDLHAPARRRRTTARWPRCSTSA